MKVKFYFEEFYLHVSIYTEVKVLKVFSKSERF